MEEEKERGKDGGEKGGGQQTAYLAMIGTSG